jgi:hypothetical protein
VLVTCFAAMDARLFVYAAPSHLGAHHHERLCVESGRARRQVVFINCGSLVEAVALSYVHAHGFGDDKDKVGDQTHCMWGKGATAVDPC